MSFWVWLTKTPTLRAPTVRLVCRQLPPCWTRRPSPAASLVSPAPGHHLPHPVFKFRPPQLLLHFLETVPRCSKQNPVCCETIWSVVYCPPKTRPLNHPIFNHDTVARPGTKVVALANSNQQAAIESLGSDGKTACGWVTFGRLKCWVHMCPTWQFWSDCFVLFLNRWSQKGPQWQDTKPGGLRSINPDISMWIFRFNESSNLEHLKPFMSQAWWFKPDWDHHTNRMERKTMLIISFEQNSKPPSAAMKTAKAQVQQPQQLSPPSTYSGCWLNIDVLYLLSHARFWRLSLHIIIQELWMINWNFCRCRSELFGATTAAYCTQPAGSACLICQSLLQRLSHRDAGVLSGKWLIGIQEA